MTHPTSFRLPADLIERLDREASERQVTSTALVARFIDEGLKTSRFPGIVYRDGPMGRRAALAGGPDVWEVVRSVRATSGRGEARLRRVARDAELPIGLVHLAIDFAATHPVEVEMRIRLDEETAALLRERVQRRAGLIGE